VSIRSGAAAAIVRRVLDFTRISPAAFRAPGRPTACVAHARQLVAYLAVVELELGQAETGRLLDMSQQAISQAVRAIEERRDDTALDAAIDAMAQDLRRQVAAPEFRRTAA
jgi:chromosomal replication initiation ATPase DnaA